jgi:uncharacterized protein (TIGR00251 family)
VDIVKQVENDVLLTISVKTHQQSNKMFFEENKIIIHVKDPPIKGRANKTILKMLRKKFKKEVKLESGFTSTHKVIRIKDIEVSDTLALLPSRITKKKKGKMRN